MAFSHPQMITLPLKQMGIYHWWELTCLYFILLNYICFYWFILFWYIYIQCNMTVNFKRKIYMIQIIHYLFKQFWSFIYIVQRLYIIKQILASHENCLLCINNYLVCCLCNRRRKNQMKTYNCCWRCFLMPAHLRSPIV